MINVDIWTTFHDGFITSISGSVPGDVELVLELEYVRTEFPEPGDSFKMHLMTCDLFSFQPRNEDKPVHDLSSIASMELEILSSQLEGDMLRVLTTTGTLHMRYGSDLLFLDSGRLISLAEFGEAADRGANQEMQM